MLMTVKLTAIFTDAKSLISILTVRNSIEQAELRKEFSDRSRKSKRVVNNGYRHTASYLILKTLTNMQRKVVELKGENTMHGCDKQ